MLYGYVTQLAASVQLFNAAADIRCLCQWHNMYYLFKTVCSLLRHYRMMQPAPAAVHFARKSCANHKCNSNADSSRLGGPNPSNRGERNMHGLTVAAACVCMPTRMVLSTEGWLQSRQSQRNSSRALHESSTADVSMSTSGPHKAPGTDAARTCPSHHKRSITHICHCTSFKLAPTTPGTTHWGEGSL